MRDMPRGDTLPPDVWEHRQRWLMRVLWAQACALPLVVLGLGRPLGAAVAHGAPVIALALVAQFVRGGRRVRAAATALGLLACSALLVHVTHGQIEAHFHFFAMVALLTLYADWAPLLVCLGYVALDRGVLGILDSDATYTHSKTPLMWAAVHVGFVVVAGSVALVAERLLAAQRGEQRARRDELVRLATHDSLTGLANREFIAVRVREAVAAVLPAEGLVAVLEVDLDNFKLINDAFGHDDGDRVLVEAAARIGSQLRNADTLGRMGGDEFIAVCRGVEDRSDALAIAARIADALDEPFVVRGHTRVLACSVGVVVATSADEDPDRLIRIADAACSEAKATRSRVQLADDETLSSADDRLSIESDLQIAVQECSLTLHYQPIVDLRTGAVPGLEALVRWRHPTRGMMPAARFIPVAEAADLTVPLGRWVLHEACDQAARWQTAFPRRAPIRVFANVSPREVMHPLFLETVRSALAKASLAPSLLMLELTENALMEEMGALETLAAVQGMGVGIALDDFGKGHSSLSHLARFPVDILKLDQEFISGDPGCEGAAPILEAVVGMARGMRLPVVAEGIETASELACLRDYGFELGQGYHFMRPGPAESLFPVLGEALPFAALVTPDHAELAVPGAGR